jgi:hypothetical protein
MGQTRHNCAFRWNPTTGRVEAYALRDILLKEELGSDYDAPFWYQRHNGLSTIMQAQQVQAYYQQPELPWYSAKSHPTGLPPEPAGQASTQSSPNDPAANDFAPVDLILTDKSHQQPPTSAGHALTT